MPAGVTTCTALTDAADLLSQAAALLRNERFAEAATLLGGKPELGCEPELNVMLAAAEEESGHPDQALATLQQANERWPTNTSIGASLARTFLQQRNLQAAAQAVAHCAPDRDTPLRELQVIAYVDLQSHHLVQAEEAGVLAYQQQPTNENLLFLANVLQLQGRSRDVVKLLDAHRASGAGSAAFLITLAESEYDAGLYVAAHADAAGALKLEPQSYPAHYVLANVLTKQGDLTGALREYQAAIAISPAQPRTYFQIGTALEALGRMAEAGEAYKQALAYDDQYAPALCQLGNLALRGGRTQEAVDDLKRALDANPAYQDTWFLLVQAYARLGDKKQSRATLQRWNAWKQAHQLEHAGADPNDPLLGSSAKQLP